MANIYRAPPAVAIDSTPVYEPVTVFPPVAYPSTNSIWIIPSGAGLFVQVSIARRVNVGRHQIPVGSRAAQLPNLFVGQHEHLAVRQAVHIRLCSARLLVLTSAEATVEASVIEVHDVPEPLYCLT